MLLSKKSKILVGFLTVLPFIISIIAVALFISYTFDFIDTIETDDLSFFEGGFLTFFIMSMIASIIGMIMLVFYIVYITKSNQVRKDSRVIWILIVIFGGYIGQIVFWFMHVWPDEVNYEEAAVGSISLKNSSASIYSLRCPGCGYPVHESYKFCKSCGNSLEGITRSTCSKCGKPVSEEWAVCTYCGTRLKE